MAGEDNILYGLIGAIEGFDRAYVPFQQSKYQDTLARNRSRQQINDELAAKRSFLPEETAAKIQVEQARPQVQYVMNPSTDNTLLPGQRPAFTPKTTSTKGPRKIITSAQAQQLRDAGVDVNDQEYTIHDAPGAQKTENAASDANWIISEISRILPLNEKASGGILGAARQKGMSALNMEDEKFNNTADVVNSARSLVARVLKSTFGGQLSDSEREYLNSVYGAMPNYSVAERRIALNNVRRMMEDKLKQTPTSNPMSLGGNSSNLTPEEEAELSQLQSEFGGRK